MSDLGIEGENPRAVARATAIRTVVVDDCDDVRFLLGVQLQSDGRFDVIGEAGEARHGLYLARRALPDLVLVDLYLVGRDGIWLLERLRRSLGHAVTLAVVTGYADDLHRREAVGAGADIVIGKEAMTTTLVDQLVDAVAGRGLVGAVRGVDRPATYLV